MMDVLSFHSKIVGEIFCGEQLSHEGGRDGLSFQRKICCANILRNNYLATKKCDQWHGHLPNRLEIRMLVFFAFERE